MPEAVERNEGIRNGPLPDWVCWAPDETKRDEELTHEEEEDDRDQEDNEGPLGDDFRPLLKRVLEAQLDLGLKLEAHSYELFLFIL